MSFSQTSVQIGAGNIGRGFLGQIYHDSGLPTTFIDTRDPIVTALKQRGEYPLRLVEPTDHDVTQNLTIDNVTAVHALAERDAAIAAIANAAIVGTSVGVGALPHIAPLLAAGINARARAGGAPLNILLCENQMSCSQIMRGYLLPLIQPHARQYFENDVGLIETVIGRMVPYPTANQTAQDPLLVIAEPFLQLPVAVQMVRGTFPPLQNVILAEPFEAYEAQKLFMHNAGHSALAYLGYLRGYKLVAECAKDDEIRSVCERALRQMGDAISGVFPGAHGMGRTELETYANDLVTRFGNTALGDTVARVAADPLRKLRPNDRLIGAVTFCTEHGFPCNAFIEIVAAAMQFDVAGDLSANSLQKMRRAVGDSETLSSVCGLTEGSEFKHAVLERLRRGR